MDPFKVIAGALIFMALVNGYFVLDGLWVYRAVTPPSPLLRALFGVKLAVWLVGAFVGFVALRLLVNWPPLPFNGIGVGVCILILELLPLFIHLQIRHDARDEGRDLMRDPARDAARDAERDADAQ